MRNGWSFGLCWLVWGSLAASTLWGQPASDETDIRNAVVKIHSNRRPPSFTRPWTKASNQKVSGTGAVIDGQRILTNAHVVNYATSVYVQAHQSSQRKRAKVLAVAPEMDLALLTVEETSFFDERPSLELATEIPSLKESITVYGYPIGGEQISVTEGIVSRIESASYVLDGFGLRIQVDAALNPGNSGGPALSDGKIAGLVFSGIRSADNIGYIIPAEEVLTFLQDVEDGSYDGKPRLFGRFQTVENEALRQKLNLGEEQGGMMVTEPLSVEEAYPLRAFDVITHVGDAALDRQGNVTVQDDLKLTFHYLVSKVAQDGHVPLTILRDGESLDVSVPIQKRRNWLVKPLRGTYPSYFVYGPMVFTPASQELLGGLQNYAAVLSARENAAYKRRFDKPSFEGEEIVVMGQRLFSHRITEGYDPQFFASVKSVNGVRIKNLRHLVETLRELDEEYVVFDLGGGYETLVFRRDEIEDTAEEILEDEGIRAQFSEDLAEAWEGKDS